MNMKQTKRAQAALEFLTTYGWAFLVILIMIGALAYFGVLNPSNLVPDSCTASDGFTCQEYVATASPPPSVYDLQFIVVNSLESIAIQQFKITQSTNTGCELLPVNIEINGDGYVDGLWAGVPDSAYDAGETMPIDIFCDGSGALSSGERVQGTLEIIYKPLGNQLNKTATIDFSVKAD